MAKILKTVGQIVAVAGIVTGNPPLIAAGQTAAMVGKALTAKGPVAEGQVSGVLVGANNPLPYLIGESYTEGVEIYRVGYGGKVGKVQNPYAFIPRLLSCCGPIESMGGTYVDHEAITLSGSVGSVQAVASGYYEDFLHVDQQLGARPESDALAAPAGWGTPTGWSSSHKLSGLAAVAWNLLWDKDGQVFGGGAIPPLGKVVQGVKVYDPRLDSTQPGGSGSHRLATESTWAYSTNPALHAATYGYGRKVNGVPVFGGRLFDSAAIDWAAVVAWANVCDANGWEANGTVYEPGDKWNNIKRIAECGAGVPVPRNGLLSFDYQASRTSLYTVTRDDLAGNALTSRLGKAWQERHNTLVPRYRSPDHQWTYQQGEEVQVSAFLTEDGEEKTDERQWDLVTDVDQVTELAIYDLYQRREAGPFVFSAKPHMRIYNPGDCLTLGADLKMHPDGAVKVVVRRRVVDVASGMVTFTCEAETDGKHAAALGETGTAPGAASLPSAEDVDEAWVVNTTAPLDLEQSYTSGTTNITLGSYTYYQVASETGTTDGAEIAVLAFALIDVIDNCKYTFRLKCDGTQVGDTVGPITVNTSDQQPLSFGWNHTPSAASHTWMLEVACNDANNINVKNPLLQVFKKS